MRWLTLFGMLGLFLSAAAQEVDLREDARLETRLTLAEPLIPLRELLARIQQETEAPLFAAPEIADDKVCVLVWDKPTHETLMRLAETLRYRWTHTTDGKGYRLSQSPSERQRERELLRLIQQRHERYLTERMRTRIRRASQMRYEQWREKEAENIPELAGDYQEAYWGLRVLSLLPDALWARVWQGERIDLATRPVRNALPLPDAVAAQLRQAFSDEGDRAANPQQDEFMSVSLYYNRQYKQLLVQLEGVSAHTNRLRIAEFELGWGDWKPFIEAIEAHSLNREWREWASGSLNLENVAALRWDEPTLALMRRALEEPLRPLIATAWARKLNLIADTYRLRSYYRYDAEYLLDAPAQTPTLPHADAATLPRFLWLRIEGDWVLARHKDYPLLRPSEIPEPLLRPLEAAMAERKPLELDDWARLAALLTEPQLDRLRGLTRLVYGTDAAQELNTPLPTGMLLSTLPALRFWAALSPAQRQTALNGVALEYKTLTPAQRARFAEALRFLGDGYARAQIRYSISSIETRLELPEYLFEHITPETYKRLSAPIPETARFEIELAPLNLGNALREGDLFHVDEAERDALLERIQRGLSGEAWRMRFAVEGATREYSIYRAVPPAAGKAVRLR